MLSLILFALTALSLGGCGSPGAGGAEGEGRNFEKEDLVGAWKADIMADEMEFLTGMNVDADLSGDGGLGFQAIKMLVENMDIGSLPPIYIYFCFEEDGTVTQAVKKDEWISGWKGFMGGVLDYLENGGFYTFCEVVYGMNREEIDEKLALNKMTAEEMVALLRTTLGFDSMSQEDWETEVNFGNWEEYAEGYWKLGSDTYELTEKELICVNTEDTSQRTVYAYSYDNGSLILQQKLEDGSFGKLHFEKTEL